MNPRAFLSLPAAGFLGCAVLVVAMTGCLTEGSYHSQGYRSGPQVQASVAFEDDYDYYPGYETYYSRTRHEFVYRDGRTWVRRPQPQGISVDLLFAAPSVRMAFRDSPERHHRQVTRSYPRRWSPPGPGRNSKSDRRDDHNDNRDRDDRRK